LIFAFAIVLPAFVMGNETGKPTVSLTGSTPPGSGLPQPVTEEHFREFLDKSPFTRALDLSESLKLTGVASLNGKLLATLTDRKTKETFVVSEVPNPQGWKLVEITSSDSANLETVSAKLAVGGEMITVTYDERQLSPGESKSAGASNDNRPPPTEQEKKDYGKMIHKKWTSLDKAQQEQAKKIATEKMKNNPNMSDRQKGEMINGILDYVRSDRARRQRAGN